MAKFVAHTFADGVDLDLEHLTPYQRMGDEFNGLAAFIKAMRSELDDVASNWASNAAAKKAAMQAEYDGLEDWKKQNVKNYYETNFNYLDEVASNPVPHLEISWTTRFNAFVPDHDSFNYVKKWIRGQPKKNSAPYGSDNEGTRLWPHIAEYVDTVNIMAYDAANITFDHERILQNFVEHGAQGEDQHGLRAGRAGG